jgi:hypothetical protein
MATTKQVQAAKRNVKKARAGAEVQRLLGDRRERRHLRREGLYSSLITDWRRCNAETTC